MVNFTGPRVVIQFIGTDDLRYVHYSKYMLELYLATFCTTITILCNKCNDYMPKS